MNILLKPYWDASVLVPVCRFDTWAPKKHPHKPLRAPCREAASSQYLFFFFLTPKGLREGLLVPRGAGQQPQRRRVMAVNLRPLQRAQSPGLFGWLCVLRHFQLACGGDDYNWRWWRWRRWCWRRPVDCVKFLSGLGTAPDLSLFGVYRFRNAFYDVFFFKITLCRTGLILD